MTKYEGDVSYPEPETVNETDFFQNNVLSDIKEVLEWIEKSKRMTQMKRWKTKQKKTKVRKPHTQRRRKAMVRQKRSTCRILFPTRWIWQKPTKCTERINVVSGEILLLYKR